MLHEKENEKNTAHCCGFGSYGAQEGDGAAVIFAEEQVEITVEAILGFMGKN